MGKEEVYPIIKESTREGDNWVHNCGTTLLGKRVIHSIRDGLFTLSGSGQTYTETVPYCPTCQPEPSPYGAPLREDPVDVSEVAILRRMRGNRF